MDWRPILFFVCEMWCFDLVLMEIMAPRFVAQPG